MSKTKKEWISNWLLSEHKNETAKKCERKPNSKRAKRKESEDLIKSPVSGINILKEWKSDKSGMSLNKMAANYVDVSPQAKAKLAKIKNIIGPYECKLCNVVYDDAFQLAMHDCPRVVSIEYK